MTPSQLATLKAAIQAESDASFVQYRNEGNTGMMADWFNQQHATFIVWKNTVSAEEIMSNGFVWTAVDALTAGKARIWEWMTRYGNINPSKANIRQGLADCFGAASAMALAVMPHLRRGCTRGERVFATGTGTDANPGVMGYEGMIDNDDVVAALALP